MKLGRQVCSLCRKKGRLRLDKIHGETRSWTSCSHEKEEEAKSQEEDHHKMSLTFVASVPFGIYKTGEEKTDKS